MPSEIGAFLRSRRARISPEQVGLPVGDGHRRVPGLRREEVAALAGLSVDYYVHLEQGRSPNVSDAVLESVARVLRLNESEREYLHNLVRPPARGADPRDSKVPARLRRLLDLMYEVPAIVVSRAMETVAWNDAATAVFDVQAMADAGGGARYLFLDPKAHAVFLDWEAMAASMVSYLRSQRGRFPDDADVAVLIDELTEESATFRRLWDKGDVSEKSEGLMRIDHPRVGRLEFAYDFLRFQSTGWFLITYTYEADSLTQRRMRELLVAATV